MFHSSSLPFDTTACAWNPSYVRNILCIPEDQLHTLNNIPEWSATNNDPVLPLAANKEIVLSIDQQSNSQVLAVTSSDKADDLVRTLSKTSLQVANYQSGITTRESTLENLEKTHEEQPPSGALEIISSPQLQSNREYSKQHSFSQSLRPYLCKSHNPLQNYVKISKLPEICTKKGSIIHNNNNHSALKRKFTGFLSSIKSPSLCRSFSLCSIDELGNQSWKNCELKRSSSVPNLHQEPHSISLKLNSPIIHYQKIAEVLIEEYSKLKLLCTEPDKLHTDQEIVNLKEFFTPTQFDIEQENTSFHKNKKIKYSTFTDKGMDEETQFAIKKPISMQNVTEDLKKISKNIERSFCNTVTNSEISVMEIDNTENNTDDKLASDLFNCTKTPPNSQNICFSDKTNEVNNCADSKSKFSEVQKDCYVSEVEDTVPSTGPFLFEEKSHVKMLLCDDSDNLKTYTSDLNLSNSVHTGAQTISCSQLASSEISHSSNLGDVTIPCGQLVSSKVIDSSNADVIIPCIQPVSSGLSNSSNLDATIPCGQPISTTTSSSVHVNLRVSCGHPTLSNISSSLIAKKQSGLIPADDSDFLSSLNIDKKNEKNAENTKQELSNINCSCTCHMHLKDKFEHTLERPAKKRKRNVEKQTRRLSETSIQRKVEEIHFSHDHVKKMLNVMQIFLK